MQGAPIVLGFVLGFVLAAAWASQFGFLAEKTFVGAILGASVAFCGQWLIAIFNRNQARRIAGMQIATQLESWMRSLYQTAVDNEAYIKSDGETGKLHGSIENLPFESALERVATLTPNLAQAIFELIHEKDSANSNIYATADFVGYEEAYDEVILSADQLFAQAMPIYRVLTEFVGWNREPFGNYEIDRLHHLAEKRRKDIQSSQVSLNKLLNQSLENASGSGH